VWTWHWWLFLAAIIPSYCFVAFCRGATNQANVERFGPGADYEFAFRTQPVSIMVGTLIAGAIFAAAMTGLSGFIF
jgi:RsiW-degrading membrane proteinase PrsW (M82 family)